jgi:hypothetical protein
MGNDSSPRPEKVDLLPTKQQHWAEDALCDGELDDSAFSTQAWRTPSFCLHAISSL